MQYLCTLKAVVEADTDEEALEKFSEWLGEGRREVELHPLSEGTTRLELDINSSGDMFVGATDLNAEGIGVRSYVLSGNPAGAVHDRIMVRRFSDMARLMGDSVVTMVSGEALERLAKLKSV